MFPPPALVPWFCPSFWWNMSQVNPDFLVLSMMEDISHWFPIVKGLVMDVSIGSYSSSAVAAFNHVAAQRCSLPYFVRQWHGQL